MTELLDAQWQISDAAIANPVGEEMVVLHLNNGTYFGLDPIGALLWEGLTKGEPPRAVCDRILDAYEVEAAVLEADLCAFLRELEEAELIVRS